MLRRRLRHLATIVFGLFLVGLAIGNCGIAQRARGRIYTAAADVAGRTWAIVPGALVRDDGTVSVALLDRLDAARALYAAGRVDTVFVSGDARANDEDGAMARWLVAHGVPAERIVRDGAGFRTRTTMEHARQRGIVDAVICTQAFHVPRSVAWARHAGIDAVGLAADLRWTGYQVSARVRETLARALAMFEIWRD